MPRIRAAAHAFPRNVVSQKSVKDMVCGVFSDAFEDLDRLRSIFDHSRIETRQFMMPLAWYQQPTVRRNALASISRMVSP